MRNPPDLEQSLFAAKNGSGSALGELLEGWRNYLLLVANRQIDPALRGKVGASDLVQRAFLQAHRRFAAFRGTTLGELQAWLQQILMNELLSARRQFQKTEKRNLQYEVPLDGAGSNVAVAGALVQDTPTPSGRLLVNDTWEFLVRAVDRLPPDCQRVVRMRYWERKTFVEIGTELGRSRQAVRKLWICAIERLQRECAELK